MSLRQLSNRIELSFWQIIISLLSDSQKLQQMVRWFYLDCQPYLSTFFQNFDHRKAIRWGAAGLGLGLIAGFIISIL